MTAVGKEIGKIGAEKEQAIGLPFFFNARL
jgi:hypothetical protein